MEVERLGTIGINVKDLDKAIARFSDLFGLDFIKPAGPPPQKPGGSEKPKMRIALDRTGYFVLAQSDPPTDTEGLRSLHLKVKDLEQAKKEMQQKGVRLLSEVEEPGFKEAIFAAEDLHGVRLALVEYTAPNQVDIILKNQSAGK
jgi:catechol 2,3-dioxygenase-like lactoylglutathione lyase family enzyme